MTFTLTEMQDYYVKRLCAERAEALATTHAHVLQQDVDSQKQLNDLINALKKVPLDPKPEPTCDPQVGDIVKVKGDHYLIVIGKQSRRPYAKRLVNHKWEYTAGGLERARHAGHILTGDDLAEWASEHGHLTGYCVFCSLELTDERSIQAGYGPTCAGKHNLPWGVSI